MNGWLELISRVEEAKEALKCGDGECWFRGQCDSTWWLVPGLFRPSVRAQPWESCTEETQARLSDNVWRLESDLFWEATTRASDLQELGISGWEILFKMQHHGFPTRLLDWTEVLAVAAYFAVSAADLYSIDHAPPAIWMLNPGQLNMESWGTEELIDPRILGWDDGEAEYYDYRDYMTEQLPDDYSELPVAIYPAQNSFRMRAQSGRFTIHGRAIDALERVCPNTVRKIQIPHEAVSDIRKALDFAGVFEHVLFPDLDGMARSIRGRYGFGDKRR
jgi:hypothetical protein